MSTSWARSRVTTYAGVHEVEVRWRGESLTRRRVPKGQRDIDYAAHYLTELAKKPQAVRQVADKLVAQLGGEFPAFWRRLVDDHGAKEASRQMARVLRGVIELGRDECERRVSAALSVGDACSAAATTSTSGRTLAPRLCSSSLPTSTPTTPSRSSSSAAAMARARSPSSTCHGERGTRTSVSASTSTSTSTSATVAPLTGSVSVTR